ncbi:hypothetical protein WOLCODRAFT_160098 [Wolfiporia cocos MD-104 SS10]|uniref:MIT domain-containing protein n=1 Tax=Wolfiporia cocos (strain MD-104) TaxID=742152 RepID=A0A2H3IVN1_WOLCO|nr:hypothetical protein WOLCODRAFT_160098 [Wolfiporia cocos MD-104 SS10]
MLAMEPEWQSPPIPIAHRSREWQTAQDSVGASAMPSPSSAYLPRRRSTAVHAPPPGPPPSQPIPNVPSVPSQNSGTYERLSDASDFHNGAGSHLQHQPYTRPAASASLAAVVAFSQARLANASSGSPPPLASPSSSDNLAEFTPKSHLRPSSSVRRSPSPNELMPDRQLLSPSDPHPPSRTSESRPSSRRALTKALELAREAVRLDSTNDDPYGAVVAYGQSVALLSEVMERVMRGEDSTESHRRGRRRSVVAQEEEVRRLKSIHDTYADRMNILSLIYSIPLPPHSPPSTYAASSVSTVSTRPSSPSSTSPSDESSDSHHLQPSSTRTSEEVPRYSLDSTRSDGDADDEVNVADAIGTALSTSITLPSSGRMASTMSAAGPSVHPYASMSAMPSPPVSTSAPSAPGRHPAQPVRGLRPRASSTLPPPAPPPTSLPPPAPTPSATEPPPEPPSSSLLKAPGRPRGSSVSHSRSNSGSRLQALQEENGEDLWSPTSETSGTPIPAKFGDETTRSRSGSVLHPARMDPPRDSHTLPPLPAIPPTPESASTLRNVPARATASEPSSPRSSQFSTQRTRNGSTFSTRSDMAPPVQRPALINTSPVMGTISQRRNKPPTPATSIPSPTDSTASSVSSLNIGKLTAAALPPSTVSSLGIGPRNRASSQPSRRPSESSTSSYFPPASPNSAPMPRKPSIPSRLNPHIPPQISINTALMSPPLATSTMAPLVPPPPIPHANIPAAPLSPLPTLAPPDALRKPYHMMMLLRATMTSKTGGYVTRRLHVPQEVWSQGGAKLSNVPEKVRVVEVLCSALEELQHWSVEYFGAGNVSSGMVLGIGAIGRAEGDAWSAKLEEFANVCDGVVANFGKKLSVGEGFVTKKSGGVGSWGGKLTRQFDKLTNGKNLDSPAMYVQGLSSLFQKAQILDEHTKAALSTPPAPLYAAFSPELRSALEYKLRHASEFFAKVVLTFVIRDMALLLDKYVKKCEKWLAE